ncbi:MAG TPA: tRNA (cytidine(34)-2'-O)-methyltransferase [Devosiaceae bacterium]|jgi:tRNA (cytidine/uridine-2'-O-)-methyltransferase
MPVELALYQPDIAQNTGTLLRLGACIGMTVHIIHPTGFAFSKQTLKRGGLDYLDHASYVEYVNFAEFDSWRRAAGRRLVLLTTKATTSVYDAAYRPDDILLMGRESAGVPEAIAEIAELKLRIPMRQSMRSLNVAIAATLVLGEAKRQTGDFQSLI